MSLRLAAVRPPAENLAGGRVDRLGDLVGLDPLTVDPVLGQVGATVVRRSFCDRGLVDEVMRFLLPVRSSEDGR
jgi:hypothetical protein